VQRVSVLTDAPAAESATEDVRAFARTVAAIAADHAGPDPWRPGAAVSDADPRLVRALNEAGWDELGSDAALLPFVASAAAGLGRNVVSLQPIDMLLGGALRWSGLARYADSGAALVEPRAGRLESATTQRATPLRYTDALGVARVEAEPGEPLTGAEARRRMAAWTAASTGYLAGLTEEALGLALEHARSRRAFGAPLSALEPVQQMLADAATLADGLALLSEGTPGEAALLHACEAAERVTATAMQVCGALGFTLEFPLQRAQRRARACGSWAEATLLGWNGWA
jgi:3-oxo-4-pregnene-20-carboxyl-CoA dehydrogenase alpha subunit